MDSTLKELIEAIKDLTDELKEVNYQLSEEKHKAYECSCSSCNGLGDDWSEDDHKQDLSFIEPDKDPDSDEEI